MTRIDRAVLVTGSNRSGTTWVGRMLAHSRQLHYIHEPLNSTNWPRPLETRLRGHYSHVPSLPEYREVEAALQRTISYRTRYHRQATEVRSPRNAAQLLKASAVQWSHRLAPQRALVKDPIAILSTPWLAERFDLHVVVMIRHPGAYVSSSHRLGWNYDFGYLSEQRAMMDGPWDGELSERVRAFARQRPDTFEQAVLMWRLVYQAVDAFRRDHPEFHYVVYEDLAAEPLAGFGALYPRLGLDYGEAARARIAADTSADNVGERPISEAHNTRRNSAEAARTWLGRLSSEEIIRVRDGIGELADRFYDPSTWPV